MKREKKSLSVLLLPAAVMIMLLASAFHTVVYSPVGSGSEVVTVRIEPGADLGRISEQLRDAGVLSHTASFYWAARFAGLDRKLRSGDYELHPSWNLPKLLGTLASGKGMMLSVTFPEGMTIEQMAELLEAAGVTDGDAFLTLARDKAFLARLGIPGKTAEGFLFPETYTFASPSAPEKVISVLHEQFRTVFRDLEPPNLPAGLDLLETVTLASMIEKEAALAEERPLVSAVFHNRLGSGTRLQSDPTVIYGLEDFDGNLTRRDLKTPTPYNTYVIKGLPPGPIANPGRGALWAALNPAAVDYYYFVSRNDGSHHFSSSLQEHQQAVRQYQLAGGRR